MSDGLYTCWNQDKSDLNSSLCGWLCTYITTQALSISLTHTLHCNWPFSAGSKNSLNISHYNLHNTHTNNCTQLHAFLYSCSNFWTHTAHVHTQKLTKKATAGCKRSQGVKSMPVKPKVINYRFGGPQNCKKGKIERKKTRFINLPCTPPVFCFLIVNLNIVSFVHTATGVTARYQSVC